MKLVAVLRRIFWLAVPIIGSVAIYLTLGEDINSYIARFIDRHFIRGIDIQPLTLEEAGTIDFEVIELHGGGSAEHYDIANAYQRAALPAGEELSWPETRYRIDWLQLRLAGEENDPYEYVVLWPRHCRADGCRYDIIERRNGRSDLVDTIYATRLRASNYFKNDYAVLSDIDGRVFWWDGDRYTTLPSGTGIDRIVSPNDQCVHYIEDWQTAVYEDEIRVRGRIITDETASFFVAVDEPICIEGYTRIGDSTEQTPLLVENLTRFQLIGSAPELSSLVGASVVIEGELMIGFSAHHKTPYLISISEINERL
ncbi:DUF4431 domain-containing protein [Oceanicaulis alexandrii]|uniref:DUF4431 domain-containing protein n=1 Tax=Oceanicaulis alexandrii TaxID=153233 RepID=UPI00235367C1|nr:DUF4431 domain-containing protein [Oceanicaulis alexandrii]